jgi:hypothetical protein
MTSMDCAHCCAVSSTSVMPSLSSATPLDDLVLEGRQSRVQNEIRARGEGWGKGIDTQHRRRQAELTLALSPK